MVSLRLHVLGLAAAAGMLAAGCSEPAPLTLSSDDGQVHLTVYSGMMPTAGLNDQASIQAANVKRGLYAMVLTLPSDDGATLASMDEQVRSNVQNSLINASLAASKSVKINGMDAMQFTAVGRPPDATTTVTYLVTTVQSAKGFHQVTAWAPTKEFDRVRPTLDKVVESFQSADGPAQAPAPPKAPAAGTNPPTQGGVTSGQPAGTTTPQPTQ